MLLIIRAVQGGDQEWRGKGGIEKRKGIIHWMHPDGVRAAL